MDQLKYYVEKLNSLFLFVQLDIHKNSYFDSYNILHLKSKDYSNTASFLYPNDHNVYQQLPFYIIYVILVPEKQK